MMQAKTPFWLLSLSMLAVLAGCAPRQADSGTYYTRLSSEPFGRTAEGQDVSLYTLRNASGLEVKITNYGGIVTSILVPDSSGRQQDIVLGFDSLAPYLGEHPYFGAIVGRYANRIAKGRFTLDGQTHQLAANNIGNHLHGGLRGFDKVVWSAEPAPDDSAGARLVLRYRSPDGEEGYPGTLDATVTYTLNEASELRVDYEAVSDKPTIINLTNHTYFNLSGDRRQDILDHQLTLFADQYLPIDSTLIPTGELRDVTRTPFDFRGPAAVGARIDAADPQLAYGKGYDHCWVLRKAAPGDLSLAARLTDPASGRTVELLTTEPALQFYSGNFLNGSLTGKGGVTYVYRYALCLEPEHFPDSPNRPEFPSVVLRPGETYRSTSVYRIKG